MSKVATQVYHHITEWVAQYFTEERERELNKKTIGAVYFK